MPDASVSVAEKQNGEPIWPPECTRLACQRAKIPIVSAFQLVLVATAGFLMSSHMDDQPVFPTGVYAAILSILSVTCAASLRMMSVGLLRREREGASRYVRKINKPRILGMGIVQLLMAAYGMLIGFSTPTIVSGT
jgi:hypothetical protein